MIVKDGSHGKQGMNSQSSGTERVQIELVDKTPPFLTLKPGKSIGQLLSTRLLFKNNSICIC